MNKNTIFLILTIIIAMTSEIQSSNRTSGRNKGAVHSYNLRSNPKPLLALPNNIKKRRQKISPVNLKPQYRHADVGDVGNIQTQPSPPKCSICNDTNGEFISQVAFEQTFSCSFFADDSSVRALLHTKCLKSRLDFDVMCPLCEPSDQHFCIAHLPDHKHPRNKKWLAQISRSLENILDIDFPSRGSRSPESLPSSPHDSSDSPKSDTPQNNPLGIISSPSSPATPKSTPSDADENITDSEEESDTDDDEEFAIELDAFFLAAEDGDEDAILLSGIDVRTCNTQGSTAMHFAAQGGQVALMKTLVRHGATVNTHNDQGWTPLLSASLKGENNAVEYLLEQQANVRAHNNDGANALHVASTAEVAQQIIDHDPLIITACADKGMTALHYAALYNQLDVLICLLANNASVNAQNDFGDTALHVAITKGNEAIVKHLLTNKDSLGIDTEIKNTGGYSPLHLAFFFGHYQIANRLIDAQCNIHSENNDGHSIITTALKKQHNELALLIFRKGLFRKIKGTNKVQMINLVMHHGNESDVDLLINRYRIDLHVRNPSEWTLLHLAAYYDNVTAINKLIDLGSDIDAETETGITTFFLAIMRNNFNVAKTLLHRGASPGIKPKSWDYDTDKKLNKFLLSFRGKTEFIE